MLYKTEQRRVKIFEPAQWRANIIYVRTQQRVKIICFLSTHFTLMLSRPSISLIGEFIKNWDANPLQSQGTSERPV